MPRLGRHFPSSSSAVFGCCCLNKISKHFGERMEWQQFRRTNEDIFGMFTFFVSGGKKQNQKWWELRDNWSETKTIELDLLSSFYWWIIAKIIFAKNSRTGNWRTLQVIRQRKREMTTLCEWWWVVRHTVCLLHCRHNSDHVLNNVSACRMPFWQKDEHPEALLDGIPPCVLSYMFSHFHSVKRKAKRNLYRRRKEEKQVENHQFMMMRSLLYSSRSLSIFIFYVSVCCIYMYALHFHIAVCYSCVCVCVCVPFGLFFWTARGIYFSFSGILGSEMPGIAESGISWYYSAAAVAAIAYSGSSSSSIIRIYMGSIPGAPSFPLIVFFLFSSSSSISHFNRLCLQFSRF